MTEIEDLYGEGYFTKRLTEIHEADCYSLARAIYELFEPESVVDLGCAVAHELAWFRYQDIDVLGVDGHSAAIKHAQIPGDSTMQHDLREPLELDRMFDVVMCIEVAEHLEEEHADTLVQTCKRLADGPIVFSAATPDAGGGTHHVNEQPRQYWINKFENEDMNFSAKKVKSLRELVTMVYKDWVPDRLFVFDQP